MARVNKFWEKTDNEVYTLQQENIVLRLKPDSFVRKAEIKIGTAAYLIERKGVWKNKIKIYDGVGRLILKAVPGQWHPDRYQVNFNGKVYTLNLENTPEATFIVKYYNLRLISYNLFHHASFPLRLPAENQIQVSDPLFDALVWFIFLPTTLEVFEEPDFGSLAL